MLTLPQQIRVTAILAETAEFFKAYTETMKVEHLSNNEEILFISAIGVALLAEGGWSEKDVETMMDAVRAEFLLAHDDSLESGTLG